MTQHEDILHRSPDPVSANDGLDSVTMAREHPVVILEILINGATQPLCPAYIDSGDSDYQAQIEQALAHFTAWYDGKGEVSTSSALSFAEAGVITDEPPLSWKEFKAQLNEEYLDKLRNLGASERVLQMIDEDLQVEQNLAILRLLVNDRFSDEDQEAIFRALDYALEAHAGVMQARPQDSEGLFHVPYSNHPVCIAIAAMQDSQCSAALIQAILLHDVIEDTGRTAEDLSEHFADEVVRMVLDVTRGENETRDDFLLRMKALSGDSKILKCLDRFHNMIRAFSIPDPQYHARILDENESVYNEYFACSDRLQYLRPAWDELTKDLQRYRDVCAARRF